MTDSGRDDRSCNGANPGAEEGVSLTSGETQARVRFDLQWQCGYATHCDSYVVPALDLRRHSLPHAIESKLMGRVAGDRVSHRFGAGELVGPARESGCMALPPDRFRRHHTGQTALQPRIGRFYPAGILGRVDGILEPHRTPFRVVGIGPEHLDVDLNHPLAGKVPTLSATIEAVRPAGARPQERRTEAQALITNDGPGMQARWRDVPTDFWSDLPFARADPSPDHVFYDKPRFVDHLDRRAIAEIRDLYGRLVRPGARLLDLMSSWHSHLPESLSPERVTGLGMCREELDRNPVLDERVVHDLNRDATLPFADAAFDAVVCTVSVEYLIEPFAVFRELARVIAPGGLLIVTFSNRWFPPKVIRIWQELHPFERPGLILEYFMQSGLFGALYTWTLRGLPRPRDDRYAARLPLSDPIFAVWATRLGDTHARRRPEAS